MSKEETRKKILKAAEALFSKNGYDGVPTKKIAKEAGITEMTLFNHFSTKKLLLSEIPFWTRLHLSSKAIRARA
jgi:AcrR family transcriptional regulator